MKLVDDLTISFGGFIQENIRRALIKECIESGDPENYFWALREAMEELHDDMLADSLFWEKMYNREWR